MDKRRNGSRLAVAYDPEFFRQTGHALVDLLADHLRACQHEAQPVLNYVAPDEELEFWRSDIQDGAPAMNVFKHALSRSIHLHNPAYMGHQAAVPAPLASLAGLMSDFLNNGTGVYEMGPVSNALERVVTDLLARHMGYPATASGVLTSGGTLANLTGLVAARSARAPGNVWQGGHKERLGVMVSEEAHYCIDRAARIMGLGDEGIIRVPVDDKFAIRIDLLEEYFSCARQRGIEVIAVVGCSCTTSTGTFDDLEALADFSEKHGLWLHVDGAHGGCAIFSEKHRHYVKGIERADSVVIDFHKMLMSPALTTALMYKSEPDIYSTFTQTANYLWESSQSREWYNSSKRTFECTKLLMSLKVYSLVKAYGVGVFQENVDTLFECARNFSTKVGKRTPFELAMQPDANIVNFRYADPDVEDLNALNSAIRQELLKDGAFYVVQTILNDKLYLRCTFMNPLTQGAHLDGLLDKIEQIGSVLTAKQSVFT